MIPGTESDYFPKQNSPMVFVMVVSVCFLLWHQLIFWYVMSARPSVRLYVSARLALDGFSRNLIL